MSKSAVLPSHKLTGPVAPLVPARLDELNDEEKLVASVVRHAAGRAVPGDQGIGEWAVSMAIRSYRHGVSLDESCRIGRHLVDRWLQLESGATPAAS